MSLQGLPASVDKNTTHITDTSPSTALVLGATGGLGEAYCHALAKRKLNLILSGRNEAALKKLADQLLAAYGVEIQTHVADLCSSTDLDRILAIIRDNKQLDWLVNAAGLAQWGPLRDLSSESEQAMFQVNLLTPLRLVRTAIEAFDSRGGGKIVHVASAAAFFMVPYLSSYCASKTAIVHWLRSTRQESRGNRVYVQALCPGFVRTDMFVKAGANADKLPRWIWMSPERVVRESLISMEWKQTVCVPGRRYRMMILGLKFVPSAISIRAAAWMFGDFAKYRMPLG